MTFEYILKHNVQQRVLKGEIADMLKSVILPAYSNLALCYLRSKRYDMVITFANQVLQSDSANVKNLYRRAVARRHTKAYDEAVEDLEKVIQLDREMEQDCRRLIAECRVMKVEQKRKEKELARTFISGYAEDKPEPAPVREVSGKEGLW
jgi:tetratricopeptide (TPR) repeat protein